jgi:hypothetical protein
MGKKAKRPPQLIWDGQGYTCDELDNFLALHSLCLEGLEAHVVGPTGAYLNTVTVGYPIPATLSFPVRTKQGQSHVLVSFSELWLDYAGKKLHPFAVLDCRPRSPSAHLKVDH